eukprot:5457981-Prymnesium_polylepis.1
MPVWRARTGVTRGGGSRETLRMCVGWRARGWVLVPPSLLVCLQGVPVSAHGCLCGQMGPTGRFCMARVVLVADVGRCEAVLVHEHAVGQCDVVAAHDECDVVAALALGRAVPRSSEARGSACECRRGALKPRGRVLAVA